MTQRLSETEDFLFNTIVPGDEVMYVSNSYRGFRVGTIEYITAKKVLIIPESGSKTYRFHEDVVKAVTAS